MNIQKPSQDMLYRYTQRKLSEEEEEQVELWLMENPEGLARMKADDVFARRLSRSSRWRKHYVPLSHWWHAPVYALLFVFAVIPNVGNRTTEITFARALDLVPTRSAGDVSTVPINQTVALQLPTSLHETETYDVTIESGKELILSKGAVEPSATGLITIIVQPNSLNPGLYSIVATGRQSGTRYSVQWRAISE